MYSKCEYPYQQTTYLGLVFGPLWRSILSTKYYCGPFSDEGGVLLLSPGIYIIRFYVLDLDALKSCERPLSSVLGVVGDRLGTTGGPVGSEAGDTRSIVTEL